MDDELGGWSEAPRQLATLNAITAALSRSLEVQPVLDMIVRGAVELSGADAAGIYEWTADGQTLVLQTGYGVSPEFMQGIIAANIRPGQGAVGRAIVRRAFFEYPDVESSADYPFRALLRVDGFRAVLAVPMIRHTEVIGGICLWRRRPQHTPLQVQALLIALADQAAVALGNAYLYQEAQRRGTELAALVEVGRDVTATLDLQGVLERIANHAWRILETDDCDIYLLEADGCTLRPIISVGMYAQEILAWSARLGEGIVGAVAQSGAPEMINYVHLDPRGIQIPGTPDEHQAMICAPLVSRGRVIGLITLSRMGDRYFVQADLDFLVNLAQQAAIAIENARLYEATRQAEIEARRRADLLAALRQISLDISGELALDRLLETILQQMLALLSREAGRLWLYDDTSDRLRCVVSMATWPENTAVTLQPGQGLNGRVFATGEPIVVDDYWSWEGAEPAFAGEPVGPAVCVPLVWKGDVRGTLQVSGRTGSPAFSPPDVMAVSLLAAQAAIAIENARLYDAARQRARDLAAALNQQQDIDRRQAEFIQNVSHELRTPLTLIHGYTQMLSDGDLGELREEQRGPMAIIGRQVGTLQALVEDIMLIFQVEVQPLKMLSLSLPDLVQAALADFQGLATQSGLVFQAEIEQDVPPVSGDPRHLRKVIDNLLSNACKFTPAGGRVTVRTYRDGGGVCGQVADSGIGIPSGDLDRIFQRFYQVDGSMRRPYGGTGLGLALVHDIVTKHGGWVRAESEGIAGQGSTFTFWLPAAP